MQMRAGPTGVHLFHRATGTNVLIDEVKVPSSLWSTTPRTVSVALTNTCDLHCPYCYAPKVPARLDTDLLVSWIDELNSNGCLSVGFGGGEPTLCPDLPSLCTYITRNTDMAVTVTTHGHHLVDSLVSALKGHVHFVRISMDGVDATYEALRRRSFSHLIESIKTAAHLAPFGINFVVNSLTFPCLDQAVRISAEMGATQFLLLPEQPTPGRLGIDRRTSEALVAWVSSYEYKIPLAISEAGRAGMPTCDPLENEGGLRAYAHIDASGRLKRTSYDPCGVLIGQAGILNALDRLYNLAPEEEE